MTSDRPPNAPAGSHTDDLACRDLVELVTDYLEGALPEPERARFDAHLEECPYCVEYLEQMRHTIATVGVLREEPVDPRAKAELLRAFRRWSKDLGVSSTS